MYTEGQEFNYEPPQMAFDKKTGEIKFIEKKVEKKEQKIIKNMDELSQERSKLLKELGLDEEGRALNDKEPLDKYADKLKRAADHMRVELDIDPSGFYVFSRDYMRVDVGLMIQRLPIFMTMRKRDLEYLKYKNHLMNEYHLDERPFADEFEEMSKLNENVLGDNPYSSKMNLDNYATY